MFADDTYITTAHEDISTIQYSLNSDLTTVHNWLKTKKKNELQYFLSGCNGLEPIVKENT